MPSRRTFVWTLVFVFCAVFMGAQASFAATLVVGEKSLSTNEDVAKSFTPTVTGLSRGETVTYAVAVQPLHGTATSSGSSITYAPVANYNGTDTFYVTATGSVNGTSAQAKVSVSVTAVNDAPVFAALSTLTTQENEVLNFVLSATDIDGDTLSFTSGATTGGRSTVTSGPSANAATVTFTPTTNFVGSGSISVRVSDGHASVLQTFTVDVTNVNYAPTASDQAVSAYEDVARTVTVTGDDQDGDTLTYVFVTGTAHGRTDVSGNEVVYTPAENYNGMDSFQYMAYDGVHYSNIATVTITVNAVNDAPVVADAAMNAEKNLWTPVTLIASDIENDALTFGITSYPTHGSIKNLSGNTFSYAPSEDYVGQDQITFSVRDGIALSSATLTFTVASSYAAPTDGSGRVVWQYDLGTTTVSAAPAFTTSGDIVFPSFQNSSNLYVLSASGILKQQIYTGMHGESAVGVWRNLFFVNVTATNDSADNGEVAGYSMNERRGTMVYAADDSGAISSTPLCISHAQDSGADNSVGFNESGKHFFRSEVHYPNSAGVASLSNNSSIDCTEYQRVALPGWSFASPIVYPVTATTSTEDGIVIVGAEVSDGSAATGSGRLLAYALDIEGNMSTTPLWSISSSSQFSRGAVPIMDLDGGAIIAATSDGTVYRINPNTGEIMWQVSVGGYGLSTVTIGADNRTIYILNGVNLYALNSVDGATLWQATLDSNSAVAIVGQNGVYVLGEHKVVSLDTQGRERWTLPLTDSPVYGYAGINPVNGQLVFASGTHIYAVETRDTLATTSDFPGVRADAQNTGRPYTHVYEDYEDETPVAQPDPRSGATLTDTEYCSIDSVSLKADIHYPVGVGPFIPLVFVHGGGWTGGSKADMSNYVNAMTDAGYLVMAVDYRLAPTYKFPAQIQDIKCAVRYLRANANYYNIDAEKIGVWGGSAGGHLASLLGTANDTSSKTFGWDAVGQHLDQSSRVQAVVDLYGPVDLTYFFAGFNRFVSQSVFGSRDLTQQIFRDASPYWDITADDAPVLAIHGTDDQLVPVAQSQLFVDALNAAGVPSYFMPIEGANHGLGGVDLAPVYQTMQDFFAQELE